MSSQHGSLIEAESRISGRLLAAMTTTLSLGSKPSNSDKSWLRICPSSFHFLTLREKINKVNPVIFVWKCLIWTGPAMWKARINDPQGYPWDVFEQPVNGSVGLIPRLEIQNHGSYFETTPLRPPEIREAI